MKPPPAEQVEREYNLRAAFPDHPQWFARWAADSAAARQSLAASLNLRYGSGPKQTIDLFPSPHPRGALLFIHGGYWRALDKSESGDKDIENEELPAPRPQRFPET